MKIYNHFIPRLLLRQFACTDTKINIFRFATEEFVTCKLKKAFAEKDIYDEDLEAAFNIKLEGGFADLLNHRLLQGDTITIDREENFLIRKFLLINSLRNPMSNKTFEEKVSITQSEDHPVVLKYRRMKELYLEFADVFDMIDSSNEAYVSNMKKAIEIKNTEEFMDVAWGEERYTPLSIMAQYSIVPVIAFWDCEDTGQEFILPKLTGISYMDNVDGGNIQGNVELPYKVRVLNGVIEKMEHNQYPIDMLLWIGELGRMLQGSLVFPDNFSIFPISPTRVLVFISPYFRGFYPIMDENGQKPICPPILTKEQFDRHFWENMRMDLLKPCGNYKNQKYTYHVRKIDLDEVFFINAMVLNMETQEFAFRDYNKIRDSLRYYDNVAKFAMPKRHDFSRWG